MAMNVYEQYRRQVEAGKSLFPGAQPTRADWTNVTRNREGTRVSVDLDRAGYANALYGWMRSNARYSDWSDAELQEFTSGLSSRTPEEASLFQLTTENRRAYEQAGQEARADRDRMLAELETYKAGISQERTAAVLARERATWEQQIGATLAGIERQYANMGRVASPWVLAQVRTRLVAQAQDALQVRRFELEQERQQQLQYYLNTLNNVYQNTERQVMDPLTAAKLAADLGAGASTVAAAMV